MNAGLIYKRLALVVDVLRGRLDDVPLLYETLADKDTMIEKLRVVIGKLEAEREYWYKLWFAMSREFEAAQSAMIEEIDRLRKTQGIEGGHLEELLKKSMHDRLVEPKKHPVPGVKTELTEVSCPPSSCKP